MTKPEYEKATKQRIKTKQKTHKIFQITHHLYGKLLGLANPKDSERFTGKGDKEDQRIEMTTTFAKLSL